MIAETSVFESIEDAKKAIQHLTTLQKTWNLHILCGTFVVYY
jgi:hypothetical protein